MQRVLTVFKMKILIFLGNILSCICSTLISPPVNLDWDLVNLQTGKKLVEWVMKKQQFFDPSQIGKHGVFVIIVVIILFPALGSVVSTHMITIIRLNIIVY